MIDSEQQLNARICRVKFKGKKDMNKPTFSSKTLQHQQDILFQLSLKLSAHCGHQQIAFEKCVFAPKLVTYCFAPTNVFTVSVSKLKNPPKRIKLGFARMNIFRVYRHVLNAKISGEANPTIWSCYANFKSLFISLEIYCFHGL